MVVERLLCFEAQRDGSATLYKFFLNQHFNRCPTNFLLFVPMMLGSKAQIILTCSGHGGI